MKAGQSQWVTPRKVVPFAHAPKPRCCCRLRAWGAPWGRPSFGLSFPGAAPGLETRAAAAPFRRYAGAPGIVARRLQLFPLAGSAICPRTVTTTAALLWRPLRRACLIDSLTRLGLILGRRALPGAQIYLGLLPGQLSRPSLGPLLGLSQPSPHNMPYAPGHCSRAVMARFASWFQPAAD